MGLILCMVAFAAALCLTWRSLAAGLATVLTVGYLFGILRANYLDTHSHFIFDAAVLGFFISYFGGHKSQATTRVAQQKLRGWVGLLMGWVAIMFLIPIQHPLIQVVGLRGNGFLLPFLVVGSRLQRDEATKLALGLSVLNHIAFGFAMAEYIVGVPAFFPENAVTEIIYKSGDVAEFTAFRIPACFSNAASYGGTMVTSLPWLLGACVQPGLAFWKKLLLASGMGLAMIGVFMCAGRTGMVLLGLLVVFATFSGKLQGAAWLAWIIVLGGIAYVVSGEERLQRFLSLQDTDYVMARIEGSVNMNFVELLLTYPLGNGMGAGGTSIPYFLQHLLVNPVGLENEYSRILLEQGVVGLTLWMAFIFWCLRRRPTDERDRWLFGKQLIWFLSVASFVGALTGTGLMTSIPQSMLFFMGVGFCVMPRPLVRRKRRDRTRSAAKAGHLSTPSFA